MRLQRLCVYLMLLVLLAFITVGCDNTLSTLEAETETPTATSTNIPAVIATSTQTLTPPIASFSSDGDSGRTSYVYQELPIAFEPKWVAQNYPEMNNEGGSVIIADDDVVIVGDAPSESTSGYETGVFVPRRVELNESFGLNAFRVSDGVQLWRFVTAGLLVGAPQIADGNVYAVTWQAPITDGPSLKISNIYCLNKKTGTLVWKYTIPDALVGALSVKDGVVVIPAPTRDLEKILGLDADSGDVLWTANLKTDYETISRLAIADGRVFMVDVMGVSALDLHTGELVWQVIDEWKLKDENIPGEFLGIHGISPESLIAADGRLFLGDQSSVYALDAKNGRTLWQFEGEPSYKRATSMSFDPYKDMLFFNATWNATGTSTGSYDEGLVALNGSTGSEVWKTIGFGQLLPAVIGNNNRILVKSGIFEEDSGQIVYSGIPLYASSQLWKTYGYNFDQTREEWLPDDWVMHASGQSVLLSSFKCYEGQPAVAGGYVLGWADLYDNVVDLPNQLVAFGPDTTPPDVKFNLYADWLSDLWRYGDLHATAYDYNMKEWSLQLRSDKPQAEWQVLKSDTYSFQNQSLLHHEKLEDLADGVWTFRLVATDTTGLTSSDETTFVVDNTPPSLEITAPKTGSSITPNTFILEGTASDLNGISEVRIFDGNSQGTSQLANGTATWTLTIKVTPQMEGKTISYYAQSTDTYGNKGKSNLVTLTFPKFSIALEAGGRRLVTSLSMFTDTTSDVDGDGISQRWENAAIELTTPIMELDEEEDWLYQFKTGPKYPVVYFVRVTGYTPETYHEVSPEQPAYILFYYVFGWAKDWGAAEVATTDFLLEAHRGDSENILMAWKVTSDTTAELEWVRTSAHNEANRHHGLWNAWERTCNLANISNVNREKSDTEILCSTLEFETDGRVVLFPGEDKHALYPNAEMCSEDVTLITFGYGEDCGWNPLKIQGQIVPGQWKDSDFDHDNRYLGNGRWLFKAYNAGEPDPERKYQLIDFLDQPITWRELSESQKKTLTGLYPNEAIWSGNVDSRVKWDPPDSTTMEAGDDGGSRFCGGLEDTASEPERCSSKIGGVLGQADDWTDKGPPDLISNAMNARYEVTIKTGDRERAGTDARISLSLYHNGEIGNPIKVLGSGNSPFWIERIFAPYDYAGTFERGDTDQIYLNDGLEGEITGIQLSQDGTCDGPGWFVEQIIVRDLVTGKVWLNSPNKWLASDEENSTTTAKIDLFEYSPFTTAKTEYEVIVSTGDKQDAGTDGDVLITLISDDGYSLGPYKLENANSNDFERDTLGYYMIKSNDVGNLAKIRLDLKTAGDRPDWYCREVTVRNIITGKVVRFPVESWLGKTNGPLSVEVSAKD